MQPARNRRHSAHGVTYIEVLIASLVLMVSLMGMVSMWYLAFNVSLSTANEGVAYSVARRAIEQIKETGFTNTSLGTTTTYYDATGSGASATQAAGSVLQCTTSVSADKTATTSGGSTVPADDAIVTVSVTIRQVSNGQTVYQTATYLVRSGV